MTAVLALRALGLGDLLTGVPAIRALARAYPRQRIVLAAPARLAPLAELSGAVDEVLDVPDLTTPLPPHGAVDVAVNLHGRGPQSHRVLAPLGARRTIAFASRTAGVPGPAWRPDEHERLRWCRLLAESGIAADPEDLRLRAPGPSSLAGVAVVHPGAGAPARRWPPERFAAVARRLRARGTEVVITGSRDELRLARTVGHRAGLPDACVVAGTSLLALARIVAGARIVVCGDTGVAHLATAFGRPSVTLFGPTSPALWGPPPGPHRALWAGVSGDPHAATVDPGLLRIGVDAVIGAVDTVWTAPPGGRGGRAGEGIPGAAPRPACSGAAGNADRRGQSRP